MGEYRFVLEIADYIQSVCNVYHINIYCTDDVYRRWFTREISKPTSVSYLDWRDALLRKVKEIVNKELEKQYKSGPNATEALGNFDLVSRQHSNETDYLYLEPSRGVSPESVPPEKAWALKRTVRNVRWQETVKLQYLRTEGINLPDTWEMLDMMTPKNHYLEFMLTSHINEPNIELKDRCLYEEEKKQAGGDGQRHKQKGSHRSTEEASVSARKHHKQHGSRFDDHYLRSFPSLSPRR